MPKSFYALVTPLFSDARPDQGLPTPQPPTQPGEPPRPDQGLPPFPAHPIVIPPDGLAPGVPTHPIFIPPIVEIPGFPTPPIYIPPDGIAPGVPSHPIYYPPHPDQGLPSQPPRPDQGLPPAGSGGQPPKPSQGGERPDNTLPGDQPGVDNTLPPVIQFPPLPDPIPDEAEAIVLVKARGQEAAWMFVTAEGELLPPEGSTTPTPQSKSQSGKRK